MMKTTASIALALLLLLSATSAASAASTVESVTSSLGLKSWLASANDAGVVHNDPSTFADGYFLLTSPPFSGHANHMIQLGSEMVKRGHSVVMAINTDEQGIKNRILKAGLDYYNLGNHTYSQQAIQGIDSGDADGFNPFRIVTFISKIVPTLAYGMFFDLETIIQQKPPKALIYEEMFIYGGHLAHLNHIPGVVIAPHADPMLFPLLNTCPLHSPQVIRTLDPSFLERAANVLLRLILDSWGLYRMGQASRPHCQKFGVPSNLCYPLERHTAAYGQLAIAPTGLPLAVCDTPSYYRRVGHFVTPSMNPPTPEQGQQWFEQRQQEQADIIYIATGSDAVMQPDQVETIFKGIDMVRQERQASSDKTAPLYVYYARGRQVLQRNQEHELIKDIEDRYPFVYWAEYAPQHWILNHTCTKIFVSHCGGGSAMESAYFGTAVYGLPFGRDQPISAASLAAAGMSITANPYKLQAHQVAKDISTLLKDESFTHNAQQLARIGQNMGGAVEATTMVEQYIAIGSNYHNVPFAYDWPWWKKLSLDVFAFLGLVSLAGTRLVIVAVRRKRARSSSSPQRSKDKEN